MVAKHSMLTVCLHFLFTDDKTAKIRGSDHDNLRLGNSKTYLFHAPVNFSILK